MSLSIFILPWYSHKSQHQCKEFMANTRSMTRKHASSRKRCKTSDTGNEGPWSDVNPDVLFLVIMQLGIVDFVAFSGVCKSWRTFALSQRNVFMASRPPLPMGIHSRADTGDSFCHLLDHDGRRFKTIIPHSAGRSCIGLICGYLVLFRRETRDFWLVNPITRDELHFPNFPFDRLDCEMKTILVFSPSISRWVFVVFHQKITLRMTCREKISFSIAGKRRWNHVSCPLPIIDIHTFVGKIYTLHTNFSLHELALDVKRNRNHKWTLLQNMNVPKPDFRHPYLVSSNERLFLTNRFSLLDEVRELDFCEMKWVSPAKTTGELAFIISGLYPAAVIKLKLWVGPQTLYKYFLDTTDERREHMFYHTWMCYFPHDCLNKNLLGE